MTVTINATIGKCDVALSVFTKPIVMTIRVCSFSLAIYLLVY